VWEGGAAPAIQKNEESFKESLWLVHRASSALFPQNSWKLYIKALKSKDIFKEFAHKVSESKTAEEAGGRGGEINDGYASVLYDIAPLQTKFQLRLLILKVLSMLSSYSSLLFGHIITCLCCLIKSGFYAHT